MSLLSELKHFENSVHSRKRVGRGKGSGLGQTSGKGHKGQLARSGGKVRRGFEGGQTPLIRRLPKVGFNNLKFRKEVITINLSDLERISESVVNKKILIKYGIIKNEKQLVKLLGNGQLSKSVVVNVDFVSSGAKLLVESKGGKVEVK